MTTEAVPDTTNKTVEETVKRFMDGLSNEDKRFLDEWAAEKDASKGEDN